MPDIGGLQLLPETRKKIEVSLPGQNKPLVLASVILAIILGLYFGLAIYKQSLLSDVALIDGQLANLEKSRDKQLETKLLDLNQRLSAVNTLIGPHPFWSAGLVAIQNMVQPQIQFQSINADKLGKTILIRALAANYTVIARQIASFYTMASVTDIVLSKVQSQPTGKIEFTMQIFFDPNKLLTKK